MRPKTRSYNFPPSAVVCVSVCVRDFFLSFVERDFFKLRYFLPPLPVQWGSCLQAACVKAMVGHLKFRVFSFLMQPFIADNLRSITHKGENAFFSRFDGNVAGSAALHGLRLELLIAIFVHLTLCSWMLTLCFYQLANNGCSCVCRPLEGT